MQTEGKPRFLRHHQSGVRGVSFSPKDRYLFCSGGCDGKINLYSAQKADIIQSYVVQMPGSQKHVNAVRFTSDGNRIVVATTSRRLVVMDVERGDQMLAYDNCAFNGKDRTGLACDPVSPHIAVSVAANGKGLTLLDLRMPLPLDFVYDLHSNVIRDIVFLHSSWPWSRGTHPGTVLTASYDGTCKVATLDNRVLHAFAAGHSLNTVCPSPEPYHPMSIDSFYSVIMAGGELISGYVPNEGVQEYLKDNMEMPVWKLRYTSNGGILYSACDGGIVRRYRRYPARHQLLGVVYRHQGDIQDMDISPYDEYLVTASKDKSVGLLQLGSPNHGWTVYSELT